MKKLLLTVVILCATLGSAFASNTYNVQPKGGTPAQCNGLSNKDYTPVISDVTHDCALSHPFYVLAPIGNNPSKLAGGDTLLVANVDSNGKQIQYQIGYGAPNTGDTSQCSQNWPWNCVPRAIPSGPDAQHPTRVLGVSYDTGCTTPPQLWGTQHLYEVLNLAGTNNAEVQCFEVTDHSECQEFGPNPCNRDTNNGATNPYGPWAQTGLYAQDSSNIFINNLNIHGLYNGVQAGRIKDWVIQDTILKANSSSNWQGDLGDVPKSGIFISRDSGTIHFIRGSNTFSGCGEKLDGTPYNCYSQSQTPGGYGDGLGKARTGGNWIFDDYTCSNATQDCIDLLYHDGSGTVTFNRGYYGHSAGNQIKVATKTIMNNVKVEGDCDWFNKNHQYQFTATNFDNCRARGNSLVLAISVPGESLTINGGSINGVGDSLLLTNGTICNGTESVNANGVSFTTQNKFFDSSSKNVVFYNAGDANGNGDGACGYKNSTAPKFIQSAVNPVPTVPCVSDGSCTAVAPACGQTTTGVDNCNIACSKVGAVCPCVPDVSCNATTPACGTTTTGVNNCGTSCSKVGATCPVVCPPAVVCPAPVVCPVCPAPVVCDDPTVSSVTTNITSNGKSYSITK